MGVRWVLHVVALLVVGSVARSPPSRPPNILVMLVDDLGIGDLGCFGNDTIKTPNIDRLASEGVKLTHHLAAAPICTPSRAALMTSRYPIRYGLVGEEKMPLPVIVHVASEAALPLNEVTLATALDRANYTTALVGKWHLGSFCDFLGRSCPGPLKHGFHSFFGIPLSLVYEFRGPHPFWIFSFDNDKFQNLAVTWVVAMVSLVWLAHRTSLSCKSFLKFLLFTNLVFFLMWFQIAHVSVNKECIWGISAWFHRHFNSMLMRNDQVVEKPIALDGLSQRLVQESRQFLVERAEDKKPFFLFHSFAHVHTPMFSAPHMNGASQHGRYGDNIEEMDEGVGDILDTLKLLGLEDNTIVYFTSDQGGHLEATGPNGQRTGGHNGRFKGGKVQGGPEGGIRVPGIYRWPGHLPKGVTIDTPTSLMDLMPTVLSLAGLPKMQQLVPQAAKTELDGEDISELLLSGKSPSEPRFFIHHCDGAVQAVRLATDSHVYKMYFARTRWYPGSTQCGWGHSQGCRCYGIAMKNVTHQPELYDLLEDPYEDEDPIDPESDEYKEVVSLLVRKLKEKQDRMHNSPSQLAVLSSVLWKPWLQPKWFNVKYSKNPLEL